MNKKIEIFLRQCYHSPNSQIPNRKRPEWFNKEIALNNLLSTIDTDLANLNIIYDNYFGVSEPQSFCSFSEITAGTEAASFLETLEIIMSKNFSDDTIIYFLEDDYLHRTGWCNVLLEAFELPIKYVTLYDHLDKYLHYPDLQSKIYATKSAHWRTTPSTTNTYACKMGQLRNDIEIHRRFSIGRDISDDNGKFLELGGLVSSLPGYSTHCDDYMSPTINWEPK